MPNLVGGDEAFEGLVARVIALVEEPAFGHDLPLDVRDTAFQQRVWQALSGIPPGSSETCTAVAVRMGGSWRCPGSGPCMRGVPAGGGNPLPPGCASGRRACRLPLVRGVEGSPART